MGFKWRPPMFMVGVSAVGTFAGAVVILKAFLSGQNYDGEEFLQGKTVIITGANTGIGRETAWEMARRGANVVLACKKEVRCKQLRDDIVLETRNKFVYCRECNLASLESIRNFVDTFKKSFKRVDVLINNAGVMKCPKSITKEGFEMQFGTNHLGHFFLTMQLLDTIKASSPSRIVNVSSVTHLRGKIDFDDLNGEKKYDAGVAYNQSKLANLLFTVALADRLKGTGVTCNAVHPGLTNTDITRHMSFSKSWLSAVFVRPFTWLFLKTPREGAQNVIFMALNSDLEKVSGKYYSNQKETTPSELSQDRAVAERLWAISERWTGLS